MPPSFRPRRRNSRVRAVTDRYLSSSAHSNWQTVLCMSVGRSNIQVQYRSPGAKRTNMTTARKLVISLLLLVIFATVASAQRYVVTDLGVLHGDTSSVGNWINSAGQVAGCADTSTGTTAPCTSDLSGQRAFLWTKEKGFHNLGTLPGGDVSEAIGINDSGEVVGYSFTNQGTSHAFRWTRKYRMEDLGTLPGGTTSQAVAINSVGVIVGSSDFPGSSGNTHAVFWNEDGAIQDLGVLSGATGAGALGNNDRNQVVGASNFGSAAFHAFLWTKARGMQDLGTFPGGTGSYGGYINNLGQTIGGSDSAKHPGIFHCALWDKHLKIHDLGTLSGNSCGLSEIDDQGDAVGGIVTSGALSAVFWSKKTGLLDLNKLIGKNSGWALLSASSINLSGQIVGWGTLDGENHGFLLTPKK
jgi:probable HAF family extracellular repeat protein